MGSFNVACSVSNVSVSHGTEVVFFPLLPKNYEYSSHHLLEPQKSLIYADCYFQPFSLPIKGVYNDYGSIEEIVEDENTKAIERLFGISIQQFVDAIGEARDIQDSMGDKFEAYSLYQNELSSYDVHLDEKLLLTFGFEQRGDGFYYRDFPYKVVLTENGYVLYDAEEKQISSSDNYNAKKALLKKFRELTGHMINVRDEDQQRVKLLEKLSGMFVHREIYDELVQFDLKDKSLAHGYVTKDIAEFYGFKEVSKEEQLLIDPHHPILMRKEGFPYDLKVGDYGATLIHQRHKEYYVFGFDQRYGKEILQHWEKATGTKIEEVFSKEFQFEQLTHDQFEYVKEKFQELTGAKLGWHPGWDDKYSIYSVFDFAKVYQKVSGEELDLIPWTELCQYDTEYSSFQQSLRTHKMEERSQEQKIQRYEKMLLETKDDTHRKLIEQVLLAEKETRVDNHFGLGLDHHEFVRFFEKMLYFKTLYASILKTGGLREAFKEYKAFYFSMYSCNRFFFPAMNGEQFGNTSATKMLLDKTLEIVQKEIEEMEDDE